MERPDTHTKVIQAFSDLRTLWRHEFNGEPTTVTENGVTTTRQPLRFTDMHAAASFVAACELGDRVTIVSVGDLFTNPVDVVVTIDETTVRRMLYPFDECLGK